MTQHTQKTFEPFVLMALANLTQGRANVGIAHKEVEAEVMRLTGIPSEDAYGFQKGTNKPFVTRRIGWAFAGLRKQSPALGVMMKRGVWALTDAGLDEAFRLLGNPSPIEPNPETGEIEGYIYNVPETPAPAPTQARVEDTVEDEGEDETPTPVTPGPTGYGEGVGFPVPSNPEPYHHDPYIVNLAIKATTCFGCYSPRSNTCGRCPLQGACIGSIRGKLSRLAEGLRETLAAQEAKGAKPAAAPKAEEAPEPAPATQKLRQPEWEAHNRNAQSIVNQIEVVCYRCSEPIAPGARCLWAREPGAGMFHTGCK